MVTVHHQQNTEQHLGEVELQWVICRQWDEQTTGQILCKWIAMVVQEQRIVTEWWHRNADLSQDVEILQHWHLCVTHTWWHKWKIKILKDPNYLLDELVQVLTCKYFEVTMGFQSDLPDQKKPRCHATDIARELTDLILNSICRILSNYLQTLQLTL